MKKTPRQVMSMDVSNFRPIDISEIQVAILEKQTDLPQSTRAGISQLVADPDSDTNNNMVANTASRCLSRQVFKKIKKYFWSNLIVPLMHRS